MISNIETSKQVLIPTLKWYQTNDNVILNFEVTNVKNESIIINEDNISFNVSSKDNNYYMNFKLNSNINKEESKYIITDNSIKLILKKIDNSSWNYLTYDKNIYKNSIKVDWNAWGDDSDDEKNDDTQNQNQDFDFQKMMESMQGMQRMNDMQQVMGEDYDENNDEEYDENNDEECDENCNHGECDEQCNDETCNTETI
jgi:hypothetical protein